ncbi:MAG: divalent cation tolerance protein CutA, partial [candidate division Zixibacteria bacterium]
KSDHESLLILKTTMSKMGDLIAFIKAEHPYDIPEIIAMPVAEGLPDYVNWVIEETGKTAETA